MRKGLGPIGRAPVSPCARFRIGLSAAALLTATAAPAEPVPQGTRAGTAITNVATLRYDSAPDGATETLRSNATTLIVAERLDVQLVRDGQGVVTVQREPGAVGVTLTNASNGSEAFAVTATLPRAAGLVRVVAVDRDGDGRYDPAHDTPLDGGVTPVLAPGESLRLFAILALPDDLDRGGDGALTLVARATTGSGRSGDAYPGQGDGGGDAVVGTTGASATILVPVGARVDGPTLVKSQSVRATDGSATALRDSVVTYTLDARFPGALAAARIDDPLPAGTLYVAGSLRLDDAPLSDAADGDAGRADGGGISVRLADITPGTTHRVQFKARIQ